MKSYKNVKVAYKSIPYEEHRVTKYRKVPMIMLSGKWLEESGFQIHDPVDVFISKDMIVLKKNQITD